MSPPREPDLNARTTTRESDFIISRVRFISRGRRTPSSIAIASVIFVAYMAGNSLFLRPPNFFNKDI